MHITVCIPTRNRGSAILPTLQGLTQQVYDDFDVIIVDQSDNDATETAIRTAIGRDDRFAVIRSSTCGVATSLNIAVAHARGPIISTTGHDCVALPDWLQRINQHFIENPKVGLICGEVHPAPHDWTSGNIPYYHVPRRRLVTRAHQQWRAGGASGNMSYRIETLQRVGPFDEVFGAGAPLFAAEDSDMAYRIVRAGYHMLLVEDVCVTHDHFHKWDEMREYSRVNGVGIGAAYMKHLRMGDVTVIPVLLTEPLRAIQWSRVLRFQRPFGLAYSIGCLQGLKLCLRYSIDRKHRVLRSV